MRTAPLLALLWSTGALAGWHPDAWDRLQLAEELREVAHASGGAAVVGATPKSDAIIADVVRRADGAYHGTVDTGCQITVHPVKVQKWALELSDACAPVYPTAPLPSTPTRDHGLRVFTASIAGEALGYMAGSLIGMQIDRNRCRLSDCALPPSAAVALPMSAIGGTVLGATTAPVGTRRQVATRGVQATALSGFVLLALDDVQADPMLRQAGIGLWLVGAPLAMAARTSKALKGVDVSAGPGRVRVSGRF